ncbi:unnamed protein product [Microthlaspi erraticum]|uniref:At2g35280-like TPR domain-containing protein n=1 Tax=Microthlaspi erraticum TaxID=1685480 RepID=A0A6D2I6R3_9BRAS|nr:unnamed protein product [Microthlaspi erraticum]
MKVLAESMTLPFISDGILVEIMKVLAEAEVSYLSPFFRAGKRTWNIAGTAEVLLKCNFTHLIYENHEDIMPGGRARRLFQRCCEVGNLEAVYFEGLRLAIHSVDINLGIEMLVRNDKGHGKSTLAAAFFAICSGDREQASVLFKSFSANHGGLVSEKARFLGNEIKWDIVMLNPPGLDTYMETFSYPDDDVVYLPECADDHVFPHECHLCYMYSCALEVCGML